MNCPLCIDHALEARFSHGIEVDVCPNCKGLWLDRGELERVFAAASASAVSPGPSGHPVDPSTGSDPVATTPVPADWSPQPAQWDPRSERSSTRESRPKQKRKKKKKGWADLLEDVLDEVLDL